MASGSLTQISNIMPENQKKERLEYLYRLLSENAQAYDACLPGDALKSERRNSLRESMDSIAETMLSVMLDYRMSFRKNRRAELVQMVFLLDGQHSVAGFSSAASAVLKFRGSALRRQPFGSLLCAHSQEMWNRVIGRKPGSAGIDAYLPLHFNDANGRIVPALCYITSLLPYGNIIVNASATLYVKRTRAAVQGKSDSATAEIPAPVRELHDYILSHLDQPLPALRQLAGKFGIAEHSLKSGFRREFNAGIHGFYNEHRLLRAMGQIRHTDMPLKEIAFACGFNSYLNFYKAFVKQFGHSPSGERHRP